MRRGERLNSLLYSFQNAADRAKLPDGVRAYDLRHTAVTHWVERYPGAIAQKAAGHASFKTTKRYVNLSDAALDVLIEKPQPNEKPVETLRRIPALKRRAYQSTPLVSHHDRIMFLASRTPRRRGVAPTQPRIPPVDREESGALRAASPVGRLSDPDSPGAPEGGAPSAQLMRGGSPLQEVQR
jgi:hypothetical protein